VLLKAIIKVHQGEVWLDRSMMGSVLDEMTQAPEIDPEKARIASLTDRECQVIALIAEGLKNKQIGERLFISETTVTHHLSSIFSKLGVSDRLELLIYAFAHKLARVPPPMSNRQ
jgi:two-component system nitrate/nitrite response regulator NarL